MHAFPKTTKALLKPRLRGWLQGAAVGSLVVLVLGFNYGPLTTNNAAEARVAAAVQERDAAYCATNALRMVDAGNQELPSSRRDYTELAEASLRDMNGDERPSFSLRRACSRAMAGQFDEVTEAVPANNDE